MLLFRWFWEFFRVKKVCLKKWRYHGANWMLQMRTLLEGNMLVLRKLKQFSIRSRSDIQFITLLIVIWKWVGIRSIKHLYIDWMTCFITLTLKGLLNAKITWTFVTIFLNVVRFFLWMSLSCFSSKPWKSRSEMKIRVNCAVRQIDFVVYYNFRLFFSRDRNLTTGKEVRKYRNDNDKC